MTSVSALREVGEGGISPQLRIPAFGNTHVVRYAFMSEFDETCGTMDRSSPARGQNK